MVSICIPTYNRIELLIDSFALVMDDERISEIVISDDCSYDDIYELLVKFFAEGYPKVKLYRNEQNQDCFRNKKLAIERATNDWCILLDSDNKIEKSYLDKIFAEQWDEHTIYTPDHAYPNFDFREYSGMLISRKNISDNINRPMFETMLNACNYFVNRNEYLRVWDGSVDPVTSDSIYVCLKWLEAGNKIQVVEGLKYYHHVHNGSHYQNNRHRTPQGFHESILKQLRLMA